MFQYEGEIDADEESRNPYRRDSCALHIRHRRDYTFHKPTHLRYLFRRAGPQILGGRNTASPLDDVARERVSGVRRLDSRLRGNDGVESGSGGQRNGGNVRKHAIPMRCGV